MPLLLCAFIGWSRELLVDAWNDNKEEVCEKAGLVFSGGKVKQSHGALYAEELEVCVL